MAFRTLVLALAALGANTSAPSALAPFSSERNDYNLSFAAGDRLAVFARSEADFARATIFVSERGGAKWSMPRPISFTDPRFSDSDPWLTPNGRTLYFVSDRPAAGREADRRDLDIWRAHRLPSGGWGQPEHLGSGINGRGPELGPELHGDVLTFAAARRSGKGGLDIYAAPRIGGGFGPPALIEGPFNGAESDSDFTLSADGTTAAFWRGSGGKGLIMVALRTRTGWSEPTALGPTVNHGAFNFTPSFSADGRRLFFASMAEGSALADIFVAKLP